MILTKAIEAAREALSDSTIYNPMGTVNRIEKALAALPDKPMTEDEIAKIIQRIVKMDFGSGITAHKIIEALKAANVLYVEDEAQAKAESFKE